MVGRSKRVAFAPLLLFSIAVFVVLSGCTEGERGILATVAIEEEIKKGNLPKGSNIGGIVRASFDGNERYVTVVGIKVFTRAVDSTDWDELTVPGNSALFIAGLDADATGSDNSSVMDEVYVVSGTNVYRLTDGLGWEFVYSPPSPATRIDGMVTIKGDLFVSDNSGEVAVWENSTVDETPDATFTFNDGILDGTYYDRNDRYYIVGDKNLLAEVRDNSTTEWDVEVFSPVDSPRGIGSRDDTESDLLFVSTADGNVYVTDSDDPKSASWENIGDVERPASDVIWIDRLNNGNGGVLVSTEIRTASDITNFGDNARGYYEGELSGSTGNYSGTFTNDIGKSYGASDLAVHSIGSFRHFGNGVVFALTRGLGLWSTTYPDSANPEWRWE